MDVDGLLSLLKQESWTIWTYLDYFYSFYPAYVKCVKACWNGETGMAWQPCLLLQAADDSRLCSEGVAEEEAVARAANQKRPGTETERMCKDCKVLYDPRVNNKDHADPWIQRPQ